MLEQRSSGHFWVEKEDELTGATDKPFGLVLPQALERELRSTLGTEAVIGRLVEAHEKDFMYHNVRRWHISSPKKTSRRS